MLHLRSNSLRECKKKPSEGCQVMKCLTRGESHPLDVPYFGRSSESRCREMKMVASPGSSDSCDPIQWLDVPRGFVDAHQSDRWLLYGASMLECDSKSVNASCNHQVARGRGSERRNCLSFCLSHVYPR